MTLHLQRHLTNSVFPAAQLRDDLGHSPVLVTLPVGSVRSQGESRHDPPCRGRSNHQGAIRVIRKQEDPFQGRCRGWDGGILSQKLWFLHWIIATPEASSTMIPGNFLVSNLETFMESGLSVFPHLSLEELHRNISP